MKINCLFCNDIIESKHIHDFVTCKCDSCYVDGGQDYLHFGGKDFSKILILFDDGTEIIVSDDVNYRKNIKNGKIKNINLLYIYFFSIHNIYYYNRD